VAKLDAKYDARLAAYEDQTRVSAVVYAVMIVIMVAFGGFIWNVYSGDAPRIENRAAAYKAPPPPEALLAPDAAEESALAESSAAPAPREAQAPAIGQAEAPDQDIALQPAPAAPRPLADGAYVAQLAALQNETAVEAAWNRLASRAPDLFAEARLDIERADLGQRGVFYRMRAGYFADREAAGRFCQRIERLGQDCIVAAR